MKPRRPFPRRGFTLIEVLLASVAAAVLLTAMYGLFARAVRLRDDATERTRELRVRARALSVMRNDLMNGRPVSAEMGDGDIVGGPTTPNSSKFPGYLRLFTTTGRDTLDTPYGDTQEVEYYIAEDPDSTTPEAGVLVRTVNRVLLAETRAITSEERLIGNVAAMDVEFYDGTEWQTERQEDEEDLPEAVRVTIHPYMDPAGATTRFTAPVELLVPWTTAAATKAATDAAAPTAP